MGLLTAIAVLTAMGLLFALDPGGTVAASGFPDLWKMDWKQLTAWGFRIIGVIAAQLMIITLWLWPKYRPPQASPWYSGTPAPDSMPAAAVSVLEGHMIWSPTILASIIEMCQRGTLRIEAVETKVGFLYRLSRQAPEQYEWERTICSSLPPGPTSVDALDEEIRKHEEVIGDQIGEYLQRRGFFDDNPLRVRREDNDDGGLWWMFACILTGTGSGFWAALWLDQWWANVLIGAFAGLVYSFLTVPSGIRTGMLKPTQGGAVEIGRWLGLKESLAAPEPAGGRNLPDPMLPYAVAFNLAQPWLDVSAQAPPWFGSGGDSSLRGPKLDMAYRGFLHAPEWWLDGRSDDAAKATAQYGYDQELELLEQQEQLDLESPDGEEAAHRQTAEEIEATAHEPESRHDRPAASAASPSAGYQVYRSERMVEEEKGGGFLRGCLLWMVSLLAIAMLVLAVLFSLDVVSPREKPCPLDSPVIPTPALIAVIGDLFRDECVSVRGTVVSQDPDKLVIEMDRGDYLQRVSIRVPTGIFASVSPGAQITLAGWLKVEEDGTYAVHFVPDHGSDRGWWRNLRDNLEGLF